MTTATIATKKCKSCHSTYTESEIFFGVARCPICWSIEKYEPTPKKDEDGYLYEDKGCEIVTSIIGIPVRCTNCPLPRCFEELHIRCDRWVEKKDKVLKAYILHDGGKPTSIIAAKLHEPKTTVNNWMRRRSEIETIMNSISILQSSKMRI
jgi:hypothetical protein